ncbi:hypothetical protein ERJ75_000608200 [Trypanosoma vivax]|nr:hypothetical protein ERJ75_000608200 [Trypanosoma vivax]
MRLRDEAGRLSPRCCSSLRAARASKRRTPQQNAAASFPARAPTRHPAVASAPPTERPHGVASPERNARRKAARVRPQTARKPTQRRSEAFVATSGPRESRRSSPVTAADRAKTDQPPTHATGRPATGHRTSQAKAAANTQQKSQGRRKQKRTQTSDARSPLNSPTPRQPGEKTTSAHTRTDAASDAAGASAGRRNRRGGNEAKRTREIRTKDNNGGKAGPHAACLERQQGTGSTAEATRAQHPGQRAERPALRRHTRKQRSDSAGGLGSTRGSEVACTTATLRRAPGPSSEGDDTRRGMERKAWEKVATRSRLARHSREKEKRPLLHEGRTTTAIGTAREKQAGHAIAAEDNETGFKRLVWKG